MYFTRNYRAPFWRGFVHAFAVLLYTLFITLAYVQVVSIYQGDDVSFVIRSMFALFVLIVSVAINAYLIFFEPIKLTLKHHFRAGAIMLGSTLGWLFIFMLIFIFVFVYTSGVYS